MRCRHQFRKGDKYCFRCIQAVVDLAYAKIGDLDNEVAKYKCYKKNLKLLDRTDWEQTKSPLDEYCLECGEQRWDAVEDSKLPVDGV